MTHHLSLQKDESSRDELKKLQESLGATQVEFENSSNRQKGIMTHNL